MAEEDVFIVDLDDDMGLRELLCDCLGTAAINYYLNGDFTRNQLIGDDFSIYSNSQQQTYCILLSIWRNVNERANLSPHQNDMNGRLELLVANMINPAVSGSPSAKHGLFYAAHLDNGGKSLEVAGANDDLCGKLLLELASEYYWILLIKPQKEEYIFSVDCLLRNVWSINLPQIIPVWKVLIQKEGIQKYFRHSGSLGGVGNPQQLCNIHTVYVANPSTGSAGDGTAMQLIEGIVVSAFRTAVFFDELSNVDKIYEYLMNNLSAVEYALTSRPRETLWLASLYGVLLPDNAVIDESGIWIKKSVIGSRAELPPSFAYCMQSFDAVEIQKRGDVQLATSLPYRLIDIQNVVDRKGEDFSLLSVKGFEEIQADLRKRREACVRTVALGLLLSDDSPKSIWFRWGTSLNPAGTGNSTEMNPQRDASLYKTVSELTEDQVDSWKQWIGILSSVDCGTVELAMRKVVSASNDRINSEDILLDSVTAWENLVGSRGANTFKVTTALGLLLGDEGESPREIQARCKKIYGTRSELIHGSGQGIQPSRLRKDSEDALDFAKRALRKMLRERKELLTMGDGDDRIQALIFGI